MSYPLPPPISIPLTTLPSHDCNYLPGRPATSRAFRVDRMPAEIYHEFMNAGFRRSGQIIYQPICEGCQLCVPVRVPVDRFTPSKSQRRSIGKNADLTITQSVPTLDDEKIDLYRRYVADWHGQVDAGVEDSLQAFLYQSPVNTVEFCYRTSTGKLLGVGIADVCGQSFSSVYFYFDPAESHRSLGTFSALHELQWCRQAGIPFYYLGFWVNGCGKMQYKSTFRPAQRLDSNGIWTDM